MLCKIFVNGSAIVSSTTGKDAEYDLSVALDIARQIATQGDTVTFGRLSTDLEEIPADLVDTIWDTNTHEPCAECGWPVPLGGQGLCADHSPEP